MFWARWSIQFAQDSTVQLGQAWCLSIFCFQKFLSLDNELHDNSLSGGIFFRIAKHCKLSKSPSTVDYVVVHKSYDISIQWTAIKLLMITIFVIFPTCPPLNHMDKRRASKMPTAYFYSMTIIQRR